jgi:hypothetical protein
MQLRLVMFTQRKSDLLGDHSKPDKYWVNSTGGPVYPFALDSPLQLAEQVQKVCVGRQSRRRASGLLVHKQKTTESWVGGWLRPRARLYAGNWLIAVNHQLAQ